VWITLGTFLCFQSRIKHALRQGRDFDFLVYACKAGFTSFGLQSEQKDLMVDFVRLNAHGIGQAFAIDHIRQCEVCPLLWYFEIYTAKSISMRIKNAA
jgi:hypothetical protein